MNDEENSVSSVGEFVSAKTIGGSKNDVANAVINTTDGGYVIAGYSQSADNDIVDKDNESFDFWIVRFSSADTILWNKTFGGSNDEQANDIIQTSDGGFAVLGFSESNDADVTENAGEQDVWLIKLDASGNIVWEQSFGFQGNDFGTTLIQTNDNGYLITGVIDVTASGGQGNSKSSKKHAGGDVWALKVNAFGETEWRNYYGGSFTDSPYGIVKTSDNGYIIAASSDSDDVDISSNKGSYDFWILKINRLGSIVWEQSFGGSEIDEARGIIATNDGNFIIVGDTRSSDENVSTNNGAADLWIIKMSAEGVLLWETSFGGTSFDVARSISKTQDGGFLLSGSSRSSDLGVLKNQGQNDAWILKVDANGNLIWQTTIGGSEIDFAYDAVQLNNGEVIAVGESNSSDGDFTENKGFTDAFVIKIK